MRTPQTVFERFEYKYWVSEPVAAQLLRFAAPYMRCDDWAPGGQRNTSLYLDSAALDFVHMHLESSPDRFKLRVRAYGDPPRDPAFFEIKRKVKAVIFKRRAGVPLALVPALLRGGMVSSVHLRTPEEERTLTQFLYLMITYQAEPKVLVTCSREAFTSSDPSEKVRLTVDRNIAYQAARGYALAGDPRAWISVCGLRGNENTSPALIERKFSGIAPLWIKEAMQQLRLIPSSYSKYVAAMSFEELGPEGLIGIDLEPSADAYDLAWV